MTSPCGDSFHCELRTFRDLVSAATVSACREVCPFNISSWEFVWPGEVHKSLVLLSFLREMATKVMLAVAVTLIAILEFASGDCPPVTQFAPCLPFVNSPDAGSPRQEDPCCKLVMDLSADCLCNAASNPNPVPGVTVDFHKALTLPKACGRAVPPNTICNGTPVPGLR